MDDDGFCFLCPAPAVITTWGISLCLEHYAASGPIIDDAEVRQ